MQEAECHEKAEIEGDQVDRDSELKISDSPPRLYQ
jgi:hypothetical protein